MGNIVGRSFGFGFLGIFIGMFIASFLEQMFPDILTSKVPNSIAPSIQIFIGIAVFGALYGLFSGIRQNQRESNQRRSEQLTFNENRLKAIRSNVLKLNDNLDRSLLEKAKRLYEGRAFIPFWETIDSALNDLTERKNLFEKTQYSMEALKEYSKTNGIDVTFPKIENNRDDVESYKGTLSAIIDTAHRDIDFALIHQQRELRKSAEEKLNRISDVNSAVGMALAGSLEEISEKLQSNIDDD